MGEAVYETESRENLHIYCHSRKDGGEGCVYLIINNSLTDAATFELAKQAEVYALSADTLRAQRMKLNGEVLDMENIRKIKHQMASGALCVPPAACTFVVL